MNEVKFLSMLGLAKRASQVIIGTDLVTKALPSNKVKVVFYAGASSENTKKRITDKCSYYNVKCVKIDTDPVKIGKSIGKDAGVCVVGVTEQSFANQLTLLTENE